MALSCVFFFTHTVDKATHCFIILTIFIGNIVALCRGLLNGQYRCFTELVLIVLYHIYRTGNTILFILNTW